MDQTESQFSSQISVMKHTESKVQMLPQGKICNEQINLVQYRESRDTLFSRLIFEVSRKY